MAPSMTMARRIFVMDSTIAALPGASLRGTSGFSQVNSETQHDAARVDERVRLPERRVGFDRLGHPRVADDALLRGVVQGVQDVEQELDTAARSDRDRAR